MLQKAEGEEATGRNSWLVVSEAYTADQVGKLF